MAFLLVNININNELVVLTKNNRNTSYFLNKQIISVLKENQVAPIDIKGEISFPGHKMSTIVERELQGNVLSSPHGNNAGKKCAVSKMLSLQRLHMSAQLCGRFERTCRYRDRKQVYVGDNAAFWASEAFFSFWNTKVQLEDTRGAGADSEHREQQRKEKQIGSQVDSPEAEVLENDGIIEHENPKTERPVLRVLQPG